MGIHDWANPIWQGVVQSASAEVLQGWLDPKDKLGKTLPPPVKKLKLASGMPSPPRMLCNFACALGAHA